MYKALLAVVVLGDVRCYWHLVCRCQPGILDILQCVDYSTQQRTVYSPARPVYVLSDINVGKNPVLVV